MSSPSVHARAGGNRLLGRLSPLELDRLAPLLETIALAPGEVLYQPGEPIRHAYFLTAGIISTVAVMDGGATVEVGMAGNEGMVCACSFLGCDSTPFRTVVENAGEALRMRVEDFRAAAGSVALDLLMRRYLDAYLVQVAQAAACNALHTLEQRCCRWLLSTQDRAAAGPFLLTQGVLSQKLGVQRTSVTEVARGLQRRGLIGYSRGKVQVKDRPGLEAAACECYRRIRAKFDELDGE